MSLFYLLDSEFCGPIQPHQQNCCVLHADIEDVKFPKINLKFYDSFGTSSVYEETLQLSKHTNESFKIHDIQSKDADLLEKTECTTSIKQSLNITPLDLLKVVIPFAIADVVCDTSFHPEFLAEDVESHGVKGKRQVLEFKAKFLEPQKLIGKPAYKLVDPFIVDLQERKVSFGYECLIEKYAGHGTEHIFLDEQLKIKKIQAIRHSGKYTD